MKLNKEIEHHRKLFKKEVSDNMPVILESERGVMIVTATGYDDFEKIMNWMGYMEKDIKWVITGTYDNPYTKYVLDEGLGKMNTTHIGMDFFRALSAVKNQPKVGEWIPVEERLPEPSLNSVIGWDAYRERCVFVQYYMNDWILGNHESVKIVAWMPFPEPYVKGEDEQ